MRDGSFHTGTPIQAPKSYSPFYYGAPKKEPLILGMPQIVFKLAPKLCGKSGGLPGRCMIRAAACQYALSHTSALHA